MSTRSVIAIATSKDNEWAGTYHHWDGYPEGLGDWIMSTYKGDVKELVGKFVRDDISSWSTTLGYNMDLEPNAMPEGAELCADCGEPQSAHGFGKLEHGFADKYFATKYRGEDHVDLNDYGPKGHTDDEWECNSENAAGSGCEYAYVFIPQGDTYRNVVYILSSYVEDSKMIGMFGMGNPESEWRCIGVIDLPMRNLEFTTDPNNRNYDDEYKNALQQAFP